MQPRTGKTIRNSVSTRSNNNSQNNLHRMRKSSERRKPTASGMPRRTIATRSNMESDSRTTVGQVDNTGDVQRREEDYQQQSPIVEMFTMNTGDQNESSPRRPDQTETTATPKRTTPNIDTVGQQGNRSNHIVEAMTRKMKPYIKVSCRRFVCTETIFPKEKDMEFHDNDKGNKIALNKILRREMESGNEHVAEGAFKDTFVRLKKTFYDRCKAIRADIVAKCKGTFFSKQ